MPKQRELTDGGLRDPPRATRPSPTRPPASPPPMPPTAPTASASAPAARPPSRSTPRTCASASTPIPERPENIGRADITGQLDALLADRFPGYESFTLLPRRDPRVRQQDDGDAPAARGRQGRRRNRPRPSRRLRRRRPSPQLRDPARRPRRTQDRPQADPRRLEAARGHGDLPRRRQEPVLRLRREHRPDPADVQGAARPPRPRRPAPRDLRLRPPGRADRPDRSPPAGDARVPHPARLPPDDHLAAVRPLRADRLGQRQPAHDRRRRRHRDDQRPADPRQPGARLARRVARPRRARAPGQRWSRAR